MAARLDVEYIEIKNFLSYGNYVTRLYVKNAKGGLGPVLVLGENNEDESDSSNGAGKSSLLTAFIWCLFGRTITNPNPGDKVVNWHVGSNCYVKIKTTDGWEIIRTRKIDGHAELILKKNGSVDETHSTSTNTQKELNRIFGLDYEIFVSSVFCGQFSKSFLEMSPVKRKEALERILGLHKLNDYAIMAKKKFKDIEGEQNNLRSKIEFFKTDIDRQIERLQDNKENEHAFEIETKAKIGMLEDKIDVISHEISEIELPNLNVLTHKWETVKAINTKLREYHNKIRANKSEMLGLRKSLNRHSDELAQIESGDLPDTNKLRDEWKIANNDYNRRIDLDNKARKQGHAIQDRQKKIIILESKVSKWKSKTSTTCTACDQMIDTDHAMEHIAIINAEIANIVIKLKDDQDMLCDILEELGEVQSAEGPELSLEQIDNLEQYNNRIVTNISNVQTDIVAHQEQIIELEKENNKSNEVIARVEQQLSGALPRFTIDEAEGAHRKWRNFKRDMGHLAQRILDLRKSDNPYTNLCQSLKETIQDLNQEIISEEGTIKQLDILFTHYNYIYRSYSDRRKIKKWLLLELIPFLNDRIYYYLESFGLDITISFSSTLNDETNKWGYEFCSGGERKRIDLAIMFALYDLYMSIYGQQCNLMILDEVDGRLDKKGVEAFSDIVNDFNSDNSTRPCPDTIFVISHKDELKDMFSSQIIIRKKENFSVIEQ